MKNLLLGIASIMSCLSVSAQSAVPDIIPAKGSDIKIQPILHGSLILEWNDQVIYVDPYGGSELYKGQKAPTLVFITDIHPDHMDTVTLSKLQTTGATFVVPQAVSDQLPQKFKTKLIILGNGEMRKINDISVVGFPMYNLPESDVAPHTKGRGNGYVLDMGKKRIYISGDTEDIPEMRSLRSVDIAFVCMNLPYTMTVDQAAEAVLAFKPKIVYPYHYKGKDGFSDVAAFKKKVEAGNSKIEVRLRNWYPGME